MKKIIIICILCFLLGYLVPRHIYHSDVPKDGKYKIAALVYTNAKSLVKSGNVPRAANALSDSYLLTSDEITQFNKYSTIKELYEGLKNNNDNALKKVQEDKNNWQEWDKSIQHYIGSLYRNDQLFDLSDHAELFKEIAYGLSYVK